MADASFEEIAAALYSGPPGEFVAARKARADEAGGDLASRILALRKPSIAAWVVNVFAHERASQLGEALRLAEELREAQDDLDAAALAKLGRERRALTRRLAEMAADVAGSRGERITPATLEAVQSSISAAFFDPAAAGAVASGRLIRALEPSATAEDVRDSVAGGIPEVGSMAEQPPDELRQRRERREAERRVVAAEKELAVAEKKLAANAKTLRALQEKTEELSKTEAELEAELARVRAEAAHVERDIAPATAEHAAAEEQVDGAKSAAAEARAAREAL